MPVKTPSFWYQKNKSLTTYALAPVSWLYQIGHSINKALKAKPYTANIPVICVGNAVAGGSGKTPTVIALVQVLKTANICKNPYILSRGYGGMVTHSTLVDQDAHSPKMVGDEPLILARYAPTIVGGNRAESAKLAEKQGADMIIMDDGLFHHSLHKDVTLLVLDRSVDFGNGMTLPAGPLREPLSQILPRVQGVVCIGPKLHAQMPVLEASIEPSSEIDTKTPYVAFAGLGRPEKFKHTLEELGANIAAWHPFPDHHHYTNSEIESLLKEASDKKAVTITTEKDFLKINNELQDKVKVLPVKLTFKNSDEIANLVKAHIKVKSAS